MRSYMPYYTAIFTGIALSISSVTSQAKTTHSNRTEALSPEEQIAGFILPEGFIIELVASEKNGLINPIDLTFDDSGRLWTQTASMYPLDPVTGISFGKALNMMKDPNLGKKHPKVNEIKDLYTLKKRGTDKILIIQDPTKTAKAPLKVWADGLTIPQSIMPYKNGAYVAHGSEFFYMSDEDNDGKQDKVTPILSGFGFFDTHTMSHSIVRGPGGWFHFSQGALNSGNVTITKTGEKKDITYCKNLKLSKDGKQLEIINCLRDNVWGYQLLDNGQWYATSANDGGYSILPMEEQTSIKGIGGQMIRPYQPSIPAANKFRVGGTGISGLAFSEDGEYGFPAEWKNVAILANPITHSLNAVRIVRNPDGSITSEHLTDLLKSKDDWFRPVNIEFGPDGCLYIADWYNKIVSHNEITTDHPDRDHTHGRIWRIRHKSQKTFPIPDVTKASNLELLNHLNGRTIWEKRAAWHQIVDRGAKEIIPQLRTLVINTAIQPSTRILALWSLEGLQSYDESAIKAAIESDNSNLRREAIRSLASYSLTPEKVASLIKPYMNDTNAMVRSQVLRTLTDIKSADTNTISLLLEACKPAAPNNTVGGNYERNFERFLARKALEQYQPELKKFLHETDLASIPPEHTLWAIQALPAKESTQTFISIWNKASSGEIDPSTFAAVTKMLDNPLVHKEVSPLFNKRSEEMLEIALNNLDIIDAPKFAKFHDPEISKNLASGDKEKIKKSIELIIKLRTTKHTNSIIKLIKSEEHPTLTHSFLSALGNDSTVPASTYRELLYNDKLSFDIRLHALAASAIKDSKTALSDTKKWIPFLNKNQKNTLVERLSHTKGGSDIIKALWEISYLNSDNWSYNAAHRTLQFSRKDARAVAIFSHAKKIEDTAKIDRQKQVKALTESSTRLKGNPTMGKALFGACLACHKVGDMGEQIAPPLDGSANREVEHFITALIDPDAAVEGAYGLYNIVRKDGSTIAGFMVKSDSNGTTIAQQGGIKTFIAKPLIISQGYVNSRSFMPRSFGSLPEQSIADLVAYIQTLK